MTVTSSQAEETDGRRAHLVARIAERMQASPLNLADWFEALAARYCEATVALWNGGTWTYGDLDRLANRIAHAGQTRGPDGEGLHAGDTVTVMLGNSVHSLAIMIGLAKIGVAFSLIDPDLRGAALVHALAAVPPRMIFVNEAGQERMAAEGIDLPTVVVGAKGDTATFRSLSLWIEGCVDTPPDPRERATIAPDSTLFSVFTSGTTGLPKAARLGHARYIASAVSEASILGLGAEDRIYVVLPMFHIAALSAMGAAMSVGASFLLRDRFSASRFWQDIREYDVTALQYLGEIARYVAALGPAPDDRDHGLRAMIGAGMQADVWRVFNDRFGVTDIFECYGSSEGVCSLINLDGIVGSVGRPLPGSNAHRIVRLREGTEDILAGPDGNFCDCAADEVGELIGQVDANHVFEGYSSERATAGRLVAEGNDGRTWYRTGDLFRRDRAGNHFFVDRMGESYRWNGENISTQEVAEAIRACSGVCNAVVYGVEVPGAEGRAGMALVEPADGGMPDIERLGSEMAGRLRPAAMPLFIRIGAIGKLTQTYKVRTVDLKKQGYDPTAADGPLYLFDRKQKVYVPMNDQSLADARIPPFEPRP
ncbi:AMP-binding protein [Croceicoccus estronivorus]|uniref:AMP-binding protein n=1 Tax=Croceicoccus estronivorus TaxID=1172626 RepID=UPI000ADF2832|nr:AMP-binding protein [Croceicoccus estronivorus]